MRSIAPFAALLFVTLQGCGDRGQPSPTTTTKKNASSAATVDSPLPTIDMPSSRRMSVAPPDEHAVHDETWAVDRVVSEIIAAAKDGPTMVVWIVDPSVSASGLRQQVVSRLSWVLPEAFDTAKANSKGSTESPLLCTVISSGQDVKQITEKPLDSSDAVIEAIRDISDDTSGTELTFSAVELALEQRKSAADDRNAIFVIVTNEDGDDADKVDSLLPKFRRQPVPVHVIGTPAPFGREAGIPQFVEASLDAEGKPVGGSKIKQGPESVDWERIDLETPALIADSDLADSGFGPFALARLAKDSGGTFFAVRNSAGALFGANMTDENELDPNVMARYQPDYVSREQYQKLLDSNAAMKALNRAAQLPRTAILNVATYEFVKRDEAELSRSLSQAQTDAARVEQGINIMYETLLSGEKDRSKITSPRWQAGYDLAMGRVMGAKARTEGYNVMLASLKQGKTFANPSSTTWVLQPADTVTGNSALERLAKQSREYLERVVQEHPGTPWAKVAQRELENQVGWVWTEK